MKKNIILAAFAAASAILLSASCQKQELVEQNNGNASGKTFTATIEQGLTKTTITNEYKVNWVEGDQIDINGTTYSATPDASDATKATFTKVSGSDPDGTFGYTAVYPASIMAGTQATLPATQIYAKGRFNAPMYAESETEAFTFQNICGVLCLSLKGTDKVRSIAVTANEEICGSFEFTTAPAFSITEGGKTVTLDCSAEGVQLSATDSTNFYISLPPATYTAGMEIVVTNTEGKTFEKTTTKSAAIEKSRIYTFNWTATFEAPEPEYVEIGGVKWATKNLGATTVAGSIETCAGYYFAWGGMEAYVYSDSDSQWKYVKDGSDLSGGFSQANAPYYENSAYTKYISSDSKTVLESGDDAATAFLGDGWRMPTSAEFQALYDACLNDRYDTETNPSGASASVGKGVYWCTSYDGVAGCLFCNGTNKLFFPAAGAGDGTDLNLAGSGGFYWSSSLYTDDTDNAYDLDFDSDAVLPQSHNPRCRGFSVRPVKAAAAPLPAGALKGEFTVSAEGKKVHFSQGNLWADGSNALHFESNQYSSASSWDASHVSHFTWSSTVAAAVGDSNSGDNLFCDESHKVSVDGSEAIYYALSKDEWQYLINNKGDENIRKGKYKYKVTVCEKENCLILAPDDFTGTIETSYNAAAWATAEAAGLVCLPAAGERDGSDFYDVGGIGHCWSSTAYDEDAAYEVYFGKSNLIPDNDNDRYYGCSVRLITDVK